MIKNNFYLIACLISINCFSQNNEIGLFVGGTNYIGDVGPTRYIDPGRFEGSRIKSLSNNYAFGILYKKHFNDRIAARIQINYAKIGSNDNWKGSEVYRKQRGKKFRNTISNEIGLGVDFNFFKFDIKENIFQMTPYIHTGIVFLNYNALHYPNGTDIAKKYEKKSTFAIPITLGYKIKPPPPYPPCNSTWLAPFSTNPYSISTVPLFGSTFLKSGLICSGSKNPIWPNSLTVLTTLSLL